jgi:hypothetical protein
MERSNNEQPRTDRQVQVRSAELEIHYLQQKQQQVIERLRRLREAPAPPREAA